MGLVVGIGDVSEVWDVGVGCDVTARCCAMLCGMLFVVFVLLCVYVCAIVVRVCTVLTW